MQNFPTVTGDNMGGLAIFYFIPFENVEDIPEHSNYVIDQDIDIASGTSWNKGLAEINSLKFQEKYKETSQGVHCEKKLEGFLPGDSSTIIDLFEEMNNKFFILRATDADGNEKVVGTIEEPLKFTASFATGTFNGKKGHHYSFSGVGKEKSPIYNPDESSSSS